MGLLKKLMFFLCVAYCSSDFSPHKVSPEIGRKFSYRNIKSPVCHQRLKIEAKLRKE